MKSKITILSTLLTILFTFNLNAQIKFDKSKPLNWTIKEKIKINLNQLKNKPINNATSQLKNTNADGEVVVSGTNDAESELHAVVNPANTDNIVVSAISTANNELQCPIYFTNDFGNTWQTSSFTPMPHETGKISFGGGDPVFVADSSGRIYFSWIDLYGTNNDLINASPLNMGIYWAYSDNNGETWITPTDDVINLGRLTIDLVSGEQTVIDPISDKQWMSVDLTGGTYNDNVYISYVTIDQDDLDNVTYTIKCKTKTANSTVFTNEVDITESTGDNGFYFAQFASVAVNNNGNVHVLFYGSKTGTDFGIYHSVSTDGGSNFSIPNKISDVKFNLPLFEINPYDTIPGINDDRLYPSPYIACSPNNGDVYVTWTAFGINSDAGKKSQVYFSKSSDNGLNWSSPISVNNDNLNVDNYYSTITVDSNGAIKIGWYDRRDDVTNNINTNYYMAISNDGGNSFTQNVLVSTAPTDFSTVGDANNNFGIGEYNQILTTDNYTIPLWVDGRNNNGDLNLYAAFIASETASLDRIQTINQNVSLESIFPNPISNTATVKFNLNKSSPINVKIIDLKGVIIKNIIANENRQKGSDTISFNVNGIENGYYYFVLETDFGKITQSFLVNK